jgi:hypothetical protein
MDTVVVQGGVADFPQDIAVGRHRLTADEPSRPVVGTADRHPTTCSRPRWAPAPR